MTVLLPLDENGNPLGILGFDYRGTQSMTVSATSVRNPVPLPQDIEVVTVVATGLCRFEVGDASVTADPLSSPVLMPGQYVDIPLRPGEHHVAFIADGEDCRAFVIGRA